MKKLFLVRHAESASNAGLKTEHPVTVPITPFGQEQAKRFTNLWGGKEERPELVVTSRFIRTQQTAAPFLAKYPNVPHEEWAVEEITQLCPKKYSGTTHYDRTPFVQSYWSRADPHYVDGDGAESFQQFANRVAGLFEKVMARRESYIVVFTHGGFMQGAVYHTLLGRPWSSEDMKAFHTFQKGFPIDNVATLSFRYDGTFGDHGWSVARLWQFASLRVSLNPPVL
jgi:broad specificity phosphatase PhoE